MDTYSTPAVALRTDAGSDRQETHAEVRTGNRMRGVLKVETSSRGNNRLTSPKPLSPPLILSIARAIDGALWTPRLLIRYIVG